jgi:hypothetical protein
VLSYIRELMESVESFANCFFPESNEKLKRETVMALVDYLHSNREDNITKLKDLFSTTILASMELTNGKP